MQTSPPHPRPSLPLPPSPFPSKRGPILFVPKYTQRPETHAKVIIRFLLIFIFNKVFFEISGSLKIFFEKKEPVPTRPRGNNPKRSRSPDSTLRRLLSYLLLTRFHLLPSLVHLTGFSLYNFLRFLAIFILLSSQQQHIGSSCPPAYPSLKDVRNKLSFNSSKIIICIALHPHRKRIHDQ